MLDGILTALGGSTVTHYKRNPDGSMDVTKTPASSEDKWRSIIAGGLAGLAGGMSQAGTGPGQLQRAMGASVTAGMAQTKQHEQQMYDRANTDFETQQKQKVRMAQTALMTQQLSESAFTLGRAKINAKFDDATRENALVEAIKTGGQGSQDLGTVEMPEGGDYFQGLKQLAASNPGLLKQQAQGNVIGIPHVNDQGQIDGMHYALVTPQWKDAKIAQDMPLYTIQAPTKPGQQPTIAVRQVPKGTMTNGEWSLAMQAQEAKMLELYKTDLEASTKPSEIRKNDAEATEANARAGEATSEGHYYDAQAGAPIPGTSGGSGPSGQMTPMEHDGMMLTEGYLDPSQLSKRTGTYNAQLRAADDYSMRVYGQHFNAAQAQIDYTYAHQKGTQDTLNYLNSLTGPDGKSGNLGELVRLSNSIPRGQFPPVNDVTQWAKLMTGNPQIAAYYGAITEVSDQVAKIMQGGGAGGTSDAKMKQANDLFNKGFNAQQIGAVAGELQPLLSNRKTQLIGRNRYLLRQFAPAAANPAQNPGGSGANGNAQPQPQTHVFSKSAWLRSNPNGDINAAVQQAQAQNYQVVN